MAVVPAGYEFNPTDQLIIQFLRAKRVDNPQPSAGIVDDLQFYYRTPEQVREHLRGRERAYFFTQIPQQTRASTSRSNTHGIWKADHIQKDIQAEGLDEKIGSKRIWRYKRQQGGQRPSLVSLHLCVFEYRDVLAGNGDSEWVLLKLYPTRIGRRRNQGPGAAAPFGEDAFNLMVGHLQPPPNPMAAWDALDARLRQKPPANPEIGESSHLHQKMGPPTDPEIGESSNQNEDDLFQDLDVHALQQLYEGVADVFTPEQDIPHQNEDDGLNINALELPHQNEDDDLNVDAVEQPHQNEDDDLNAYALELPHQNEDDGLNINALEQQHQNEDDGLNVNALEQLFAGLEDVFAPNQDIPDPIEGEEQAMDADALEQLFANPFIPDEDISYHNLPPDQGIPDENLPPDHGIPDKNLLNQRIPDQSILNQQPGLVYVGAEADDLSNDPDRLQKVREMIVPYLHNPDMDDERN